jgi:acetyl esterase
MRLTSILVIGLALAACTSPSQAQQRRAARENQPADSNESLRFEGARTEVYKTIGDVKLTIHIFEPAGHKPGNRRPAIVFFFGGGWRSGSPRQFEQHCRYLASRGMVAMTADYRVLNRHGTPAVKCVEDGKSAVRWVRANAKRLGVDAQKIAAGGGSAGGHVAACTGVIDGFEAEGEDTAISSKPNAMVLFNPALALALMRDKTPLSENQMEGLKERFGTEPKNLSPVHHVRKGAPPAIVLHGKEDTFEKAMREAGNRCELVGYEGQPHSFFNYGRGRDNPHFVSTVKEMDRFLASLGYLKGEPKIEGFLRSRAP